MGVQCYNTCMAIRSVLEQNNVLILTLDDGTIAMPFKVRLSDHVERTKWLTEHIGMSAFYYFATTDNRWCFWTGDYWFVNEHDAVLFKLRFG